MTITTIPSGGITRIGPNWQAQSASQPWSCQVDGETYRFEVRTGDQWSGDNNAKERSELCGLETVPFNQTLIADFDFMLEPGPISQRPWLIIFQVHTDDAIAAMMSPPLAINIMGDPVAGKEYLCVNGESSQVNPITQWAYTRTFAKVPFTRGVTSHIHVEYNDAHGVDTMPFINGEQDWQGHCGYVGSTVTNRFGTSPNGMIRVAVNGIYIANFPHIATGYAVPTKGPYPKIGLYTSSQHPATDTGLVAHYGTVRVN